MFRYVLALAAILVAYLYLSVFAPFPLDPRLALAFAVSAVLVLFFLVRRIAPAAGRGLAYLVLIALGVLPLGACAMNSTNVELLKQIDTNFAACDRHITVNGGVGVVTPGVQVNGSVDCKGAASPATAPAPGAAGGAQ